MVITKLETRNGKLGLSHIRLEDDVLLAKWIVRCLLGDETWKLLLKHYIFNRKYLDEISSTKFLSLLLHQI